MALMVAGLLLGVSAPRAFADDPCLGIDANGDAIVDQAPAPGSNCQIVSFSVEPEKGHIVDLEFANTHAAVLKTSDFDPARVVDVPLCFGDADVPANRACEPVTLRGKFRDVNGDGLKDKIWKWPVGQTHIQSSDTSACFHGTTTDGLKIQGCGYIADVINGPNSELSVNDVAVSEGDSGTTAANFTVTLSPSSAQQVTVSYATADGSATAPGDYASTSGVLSFTPGETTKTVSVDVAGDTAVEPTETFLLGLSGSTGADIVDGSGTGSILSDDVAPAASIGDVSASEGNAGSQVFSFPVTISPPAADGVSVDWSTADGTATAPTDYEGASGTLSFAPGEATKYVDVVVNGDTDPEGTETFSVSISSNDVIVGDGQGLGSIVTDDGTPSVSISDLSVVEGSSGTHVVSFAVSLSMASGGQVSVNYATANGKAVAPGDYTATAGTLVFAPGELSKTIDVVVKGDQTTERDEDFFVNLSAAVGATIADPQGRCLILTDD